MGGEPLAGTGPPGNCQATAQLSPPPPSLWTISKKYFWPAVSGIPAGNNVLDSFSGAAVVRRPPASPVHSRGLVHWGSKQSLTRFAGDSSVLSRNSLPSSEATKKL